MPLTYDQRLRTFTAWPRRSPSASEMAAAGFVFIGENPRHYHSADAVQCLDCRLLVEAWLPGYMPFAEHARWGPDGAFVVGQQAPAPKNSRAASMQSSATAYRNGKVLFTPHTPLLFPAKPYNLAKREAEDIKFSKEETKTLVEQRDRAVADLAAEKEAHKKALEFWNAETKKAKAAVANAQAKQEALEAAQTTEIHELKTQFQALTTTITPLHAAIEGLTAAITQFQTDKLTTHHGPSSEVNSHNHHAAAFRHTPNKDPVDADSQFSPEASSNPSDKSEAADLKEADVNTEGSRVNASTGYSDAEEAGSRYTIRNEENDSTNRAEAAEDSFGDNGLSNDDSWSVLEPISPSSDGADGVGFD